ncbi:hypothetical protein [Hydrogenophilus thermoluteolus]|uniref:hypothetical protein n=1 Tax=Hydrogenophilus thermoluteolus TaxID=297 RepID=UPI000E6553B3|nr:hypothetical protein [Hydrogenophilus thermoluteolus]MBW7656166.1 hypothetical protein [Hydrogenophilus thermoluteolus]
MTLRSFFRSVVPRRVCIELFAAPRDRAASDPPPEPRVREVTLAWIDTPTACHAHLAPFFATDPHLALVDRVAPSRFARGDLLWVLRAHGDPVHFAWTRHDGWLDLSYELGRDACWSLPPKSVVIYDCYTLGAARGRGHYPVALRCLCDHFPTATLWIYCASQNCASLSGIRKAGFAWQQRLCRWRWLSQ